MKTRFLFFLCWLLPLVSFSAVANQLDHIQQRGELTVISRYTPTAYHHNREQQQGLEYELVTRFAASLGVKLNIIIPDNLDHLIHLLNQGHADIAAAGLTVTEQRQALLRFGPSYQEITQQLVYRHGNKRPRNIAAVENKLIEVVADSSHVQQLTLLKQQHPELNWIETNQLDSAALLELVQLEMIDYTIADSNEIAALQNYYPEIRTAFDISPKQSLAWALSHNEDNSLYDAVNAFFKELNESGELARLINKYYGYLNRFDYVDTRAFYRKLITELPKYQPLFEQQAQQANLDWRLLAAIAYQESHWDPKAVSPTGVRGLMMITRATAKQMKITDREDPEQSIVAGTRYLNLLKDKLPDRIIEPDKTWLALAAYNVGFGHLEDARILTQQNGMSPDYWPDVKQHLPLLSKKKWYSKTRNGYARGKEPVTYVENIRRYYDILLYDRYKTKASQDRQGTKPSNYIPNAL